MTFQPSANRRPTVRGQVDTGKLWTWVDRLTQPSTEKLHRRFAGQRKSVVEHVPVPSVWTQAVDALASSNSGGGSGKAGFGSRSPMDLALAALMMEIERDVIAGLAELGGHPRVEEEAESGEMPARAPAVRVIVDPSTLDPQRLGLLLERSARGAADERARLDTARYIHDTATDLRQLAERVASSGDQERIDRWERRYRSWVTRAEEALAIDDESIHMRGIRGFPCPHCLALWVTSERDGERVPDAAIVARFRDGFLQHLLCRACGVDWVDDIDDLVQWVAENEAEFGPAHLWGETVKKAGA